jgi:hypothetical protein
VLDRNIGLLLKHAYVPALPKPAFRAELERQWLAGVRRNASLARARDDASKANERAPGVLRRLVPLAAAAAVLAGLFLAWSVLGPRSEREGAPTAAQLVAEGRVAVRPEADGAWRAATAEELARGIELAGELALALPEDSAIAVLVEPAAAGGAADRILAHGPAELSVTSGNGRVEGTLTQGNATLSRASGDRGGTWSLRTGPGRTLFDRGELEVEKAGALERMLLANGAARYEGPGAAFAIELLPGRPLRVVDGVPEEGMLAARAPADPRDDRRAVETGHGDPDEEAASPEPPPVRGAVVGHDGTPVTSFEVALLHERVGNNFGTPERRAIADATGRFAWNDDVRDGRYDVFVQAEGHALASLGRFALGEEPLPDLEVQLTRGGALRGHVVERATGAPIRDALVLSIQDAPQNFFLLDRAGEAQWLPASARTRADGSFELPHLTPGRHQLLVSASGYGPIWPEEVVVQEDGVRDGLLFELGPGGTLQGRVTRTDGTPRSEARVLAIVMDQVESEKMCFVQIQTGEDGSYRIEDLPLVSMLAVLIETEDDPTSPRPLVRPFEPRAEEPVTIDFLGQREGVQLTGRLLDAGGAPIPFQNVALFDKALGTSGGDMEDFSATTTGADGVYVFEDLQPVTYLAYLVHENGRAIQYVSQITVPDLSEHTADLRLASCTLEGTVRDGRNGEPVGRAALILEVEDPLSGEWLFAGNVPCGPDGSYRATALAPGRYVITAYPEKAGLGFERSPELVLTATERDARVDFALQAGGAVVLEVVDGDGLPVVGAWVELLDEAGNWHTFSRVHKTDDDGRHACVGLAYGRYTALARKQDHEDGSSVFDFGPDGPETVRLVIRKKTQGAER